MKKILAGIFILINSLLLSRVIIAEELPLFPLNPSIPTKGEDIEESGDIRTLEKTYTVMVEAKVNIGYVTTNS